MSLCNWSPAIVAEAAQRRANSGVRRYETTQGDVKIGPINEFGGKLWNLHEFGGVAKGRRLLTSHRIYARPVRSESRQNPWAQHQLSSHEAENLGAGQPSNATDQ